MKKFLKLVFISLFVSTGYAAAGGNIAGTIKGPDGSPSKLHLYVPRMCKPRWSRLVLSKCSRKYLVNVAPGTYEVWANSVEYKSDPAKRSDIKVDDGQTVNLNFKMQKGTLQMESS